MEKGTVGTRLAVRVVVQPLGSRPHRKPNLDYYDHLRPNDQKFGPWSWRHLYWRMANGVRV